MIWIARVSSVLMIIFISWIIYLANTSQSCVFFDAVGMVPFGDKCGHIVLACLLALLLNLMLPTKSLLIGQYSILAGGILTGIVLLGEEISQIFIPTRTFDVLDLAADLTGIVIAQLIVSYLHKGPKPKFNGQNYFNFLDRFKPKVKTRV